MKYQTIADHWRKQQIDPTRASTGVVLIWDGEVYGWKNSLRNAGHERPNAVAVDTDGHVFVAEGGDDQDGAKCWVSKPPHP